MYRIGWLPTKLESMPLEGHKMTSKTAHDDKYECEDPKARNLHIQPAKLQFWTKSNISFWKQNFPIRRVCNRKISLFEAH